jgi:hypothetical protein
MIAFAHAVAGVRVSIDAMIGATHLAAAAILAPP